MRTLSIHPGTTREWKCLGLLYGTCCSLYYFATWQAYGGFSAGHPPLLDLEEFVAAAGLKFTIFFGLTLLLFRVIPRARATGPESIVLVQHAAFLAVFVLLSDWLQTLLLGYFHWAHFFGGRLYVFNHLIAGGFYALQFSFLAALKSGRREPQVPRPLPTPLTPAEPGTEWILARKGDREVPLVMGNISYVMAYGNYCRAAVGDELYLLSLGLGTAERRLSGLPFLRIHRSYLINLEQVVHIYRDGRKYQVQLTSGTVLPVGASYLPRLKALRN